MTVKLTDIFKQIPNTSTDDLNKILDMASKELDFRKLKEYIDYVPNVIDGDLATDLMK